MSRSQRMKLEFYTTPHIKINSGCITDRRIRVKTQEPLEENKAINVLGFHKTGFLFLDITSQTKNKIKVNGKSSSLLNCEIQIISFT